MNHSLNVGGIYLFKLSQLGVALFKKAENGLLLSFGQLELVKLLESVKGVFIHKYTSLLSISYLDVNFT